MVSAQCFPGVSSVMKVFATRPADRSRTPVRAVPPPPPPLFTLTPRPHNKVLMDTPTHNVPEHERAKLLSFDLGRAVARQYPAALVDQTAEMFQDTLLNKPYHERRVAVRKFKLNAVAAPNYADTCKAIALAQDFARLIRTTYGYTGDTTEHFSLGMIDAAVI